MGQPNTRKLDRAIRDLESKLAGARNQEAWVLTSSEKARFLANAGRTIHAVGRGKSPNRADRNIDRIFEGAESRFAAELTAAKTVRQKVISEAAAAKVAKRTESKWW